MSTILGMNYGDGDKETVEKLWAQVYDKYYPEKKVRVRCFLPLLMMNRSNLACRPLPPLSLPSCRSRLL